MKSLLEFINEQAEINEAASKSKTFTFNFKDLENGEDTLKSFEEKENCKIEDNKLTITVNDDNFDKLTEIVDSLKKYSDTIRKSQKVSSDEQYAQKTKSFEDKVNELTIAIEELKNPDDEKNKEEE